MFTGLVEGLGTIRELIPEESAVRLRVELPAELVTGTQLGDSIAINGCCLTVIEVEDNLVDFQAGSETLSRTNLGLLQPGDQVNLERALAAGARLGGHFVQGHVDACGKVVRIEEEGEWIFMRFTISAELDKQMVSKGSITVDGISLTLVDVRLGEFSVALIPHTLEVTTLGQRKVGDMVNIETDILGKYIQKLTEGERPPLGETFNA